MLIHAIRVLLPVMGVFCLTGNMLSGGEYKPDFFRGVNAGQKFRCEAKADYLAEHYLRGSIESAKTTFKNIRIELAGILTVTQTLEAQPVGLELKIEQFACLENGVKYQTALDGRTVIIRRDGDGKTIFAFNAPDAAVAAKDALLLGMIFDFGTIQPADRTIWGYPGIIHTGSSWSPDLEIFRGQLLRLNLRPEKMAGRVALKERREVFGTDCLMLDMEISCFFAAGETCAVSCHAAFPADNAVYGPVKNNLSILRKRQIKLPENEPLAAGQTMHSEEKFQLETIMLPLKSEK